MDDLKQFIYSQPNPRTGKNYAPGEQIPKSEYAALTAKFEGASAPAADMSSFTGSKPNPLTNLPEAPAYEPQTLSLTEQEMQPTLVSENPVVRFAESQPEPQAQAQQAPAAQAAPQDDFYNWTTNTYKEDLQRYKGDLAALTEELNQGRIKTPQFLSRKKLLESEFSPVIASAIPNFDSQQQALFKQLTDAGVASEDAVFQVGSMRRANTGASVDPKVLDDQLNQSSYRLAQLTEKGFEEASPEVQNEKAIYQGLQEQRLGRQKTSSLNKLYENTADLKALEMSFKGGEINEETYNTKKLELSQVRPEIRRAALTEDPSRIIDTSVFETDPKTGAFTLKGREDLAAALEPYKGSVVGISGKFKGSETLVPKVVTPAYIKSVLDGKDVAPREETPQAPAPESAVSAARALKKVGCATDFVGDPSMVAANVVRRYAVDPVAKSAVPWVTGFVSELLKKEEEEE
jgi:hypothetical protein